MSRRILLICASATILALPAATAAGARQAAKSHGFLVVHDAAGDGGVAGPPVVTLVVDGFVLGRVSQEGAVEIYHPNTGQSAAVPQVSGSDIARASVRWHGVPGTEYTGSDFRFRAVGGAYRVVIRGSGIFVFAGGHGHVTLLGSTDYPFDDGAYSVNGGRFRSLPSPALTRVIGQR